MSSVVLQWLNNDVQLSKRVTKENIDTDFRNGYLFGEILKRYQLIEPKIFDSLFYNGHSQEIAIRNYSLLETGLIQKLGLKLKANRVYDIIQGKPGEAAKLLYDIKNSIEIKKMNSSNATGKSKINTFISGNITKKPYLMKEHNFFVDRLQGFSKALSKPKNKSNPLSESNEPRSELDVIYKPKEPTSYPLEIQKKKEIQKEKPKYNLKPQYDLNIMRLEREKKKKKIADQEARLKSIKKEFIDNIENFERNLKNNERLENSNYHERHGNNYDQAVVSELDPLKVDNKIDQQAEMEEIKHFLKYQRTMDPSTYMRMIQRKIPSIETSMKQTHDYVNRIHERKVKEEETNKEKKYRRRKILLAQQKSRKENEKVELNNLLANKLLNESKQEKRIAEQLMEIRKQKNLIYENRCKRNQQYAEKRIKDYEIALKREEELGKKAKEEYEMEAELLKNQYNEIILNKEEEKKQETHEKINKLVWELVDFAFKICEYKTLNDGYITKKQMDEWKILFIKGLPLDDKYFLDINQDKIDIFNNEFLEEKKEPLEINPEILSRIQNINIEGFDLNKPSSQARIELLEEKSKPTSQQTQISKESNGSRVVTGETDAVSIITNNTEKVNDAINNKNDNKNKDNTNDNNNTGVNNENNNNNNSKDNEKKPSSNGDDSINLVISCGNKKKMTAKTPDKHEGSKDEENPSEGILVNEIVETNPDFPNSVIAKLAEKENANLIQVNETNSSVLKGIQILDEKEYKNYIKGEKNWEYTFCPTPPDVPKRMYESLYEIIDTLAEITRVPEEPYELAVLPKVPMRMSIIGKRFSGKMTLATKLASKFNLAILSLEDLIKEAIRVSTIETKSGNEDTNELNSTFKSKKSSLTRAQIGSEIQIKMLEGGYPNDELLVQLIIDAISRVNIDHPDCKGGWILVNFPQNREQAILLERELTGYEEPKKIKPTLPKRKANNNVKNNVPYITKKPSTPAEDAGKAKETKLEGGLDLVLLMTIDNDIAFKRMTGRKIDTLTGKIYHLEYNPPPDNEPGIYERLAPFNDEVNNLNIQNQIASFDAHAESLKEFFNKFKNLHELDGSKAVIENVDRIQTIIDDIENERIRVEEKKKRDEERKLEEAKREFELQKERELERKKKEELENLEKTQEEAQVENEQEVSSSQGQNETTKGANNKGNAKEDDKKKNNRSRTQSGKEKDKDKDKEKEKEKEKEKDKDSKRKNNSASGNNSTVKGQKVGKDNKKKDAQDNQDKNEEVVLNYDEASELQIFASTNRTPVISSNGKKCPAKGLAEILIDVWASIEVNYVETLKFIFRSLRREQDAMIRYIYNTKVNFKKYLERPDDKQSIVTAFQEDYNQMDDDLRCDPEAKAELHQRTDDLKDKLFEVCEKRKEEAEQERNAIIEDRWIEDHLNLIINIYITMMQVESDHTIGINQLVYDYYIDSNGFIINDDSMKKLRIPMYGYNVDASTDQKQSGSMDNLTKSTQKGKTNGGDNQDSKNNNGNQNNKGHASNLLPSSGSSRKSFMVRDRHQSSQGHNNFFQDLDGVPYVQYIDNAYNLAYSNNVAAEVVVADKEKKEKKKQNATEPVIETKKLDVEEELPKDYGNFIQLNETNYHLNLERIQVKAKEHIKDLQKHGIDVFNLLNEWITARYQIEINAINELIIVIKEAIECEARLPNELILEGENFKVNYDILTYVADPLPPSKDPTEKLTSEKFTVVQLMNISKMLNEYSGTGIISTKEFIDCFMKLIVMSTGMEYLPEDYMNTDVNQIKQITDVLDPLDTGYINWRKFIINQARVLPVPSVEYITYLKEMCMNLPSYQNGKITKSDYMSLKLWYEDMDEEIDNETITIYKRYKNLKEAMFYFFMVKNPIDSDEMKFLEECQKENENEEGANESEEKLNEGEADKKSEPVITISNNDKDEVNNSGNTENNDNMNATSKTEPPTEVNDSVNNTEESFEKNEEGVENNEDNTDNNETTNEENDEEKICDEELFDVNTFLMCCCCDTNQKTGIEKAFNVISDNGLVTAEDLYSIYNYGLYIVDDNYWHTEKEADIPYPRELFYKIFEDLNVNPEERVSFKQVMEIAEKNYPALLTCPFYQLEKIVIEKNKQ